MSYSIKVSQYSYIIDPTLPSSMTRTQYYDLVEDFIYSELVSVISRNLSQNPKFSPRSQDYLAWKGSFHGSLTDSFSSLVEYLSQQVTSWKVGDERYVGFSPVSTYRSTNLRVVFLVKSIDYGTRLLGARHYFDREFSKFRYDLPSILKSFIRYELR